MNILLVISLLFFLSCTMVDLNKKTQERIEILEKNYRELDDTLQFVGDKIRVLQQQVENLKANLNSKTSDLENFSVDLDLSTPHRDVPVPFLREDQEFASKQGLKLRSKLYRLLNSINRGDFITTLKESENLQDYSYIDEVQKMVKFWRFFGLVQVGKLTEALAESGEILSKYPSYNRIPYILFKQAGIFDSMGDKKARDIALQKLVKDFPASVEAKEAKRILQRG